MNERIKLLFEQAHIQPPATVSGQFAFTPPKTFSPEKFAELIVQECMWKIMQRKEEAIDNDWHVDEAMSAAISDISEHFGVEE